MKRKFMALMALLLPPIALKTWLLRLGGWKLEKSVRIGHSWIEVDTLKAEGGAGIGHFNLITVAFLVMSSSAKIGHVNLIRGPLGVVLHESAAIGNRNRVKRSACPVVWGHSCLTLGVLAKITVGHLVDCTRPIWLGDYTTLAGAGSQLWTHGYIHAGNGPERVRIDGSIRVGHNVYIGSASVISMGVTIASGVMVGAATCVANSLHEPGLYVGQGLRRIPLDYGQRVAHGSAPRVDHQLSDHVIVKKHR